MALKTTLEQLEEVQEAITKVLAAQAMGSGSDSVQRAQLATLYKREDQLLARYRSEQSTGGPVINTGLPRRD